MGLTQNLGRLSPSIFSDASLNIGVGAAPSGSYKFEVTGTSKVSGVLTLGSTLSNGTYTYTLPSATGTLALVGGAGVGTVTSVAALTLGTTGTDLSSTVANSTTTPVITLNVPTASAANRGALSSADWSTFNSKQGTITLTTTGTSGAATFTSNTLNIPDYGSALSGYLPLTGGTLTGPLSGTSASFSSTLLATGVGSNTVLSGTGLKVTSSNANLYLNFSPSFTGGVEGEISSSDNGLRIVAASTSSSPNSLRFLTSNASGVSTLALTLSGTQTATFTGALSGTSASFSGIITSSQYFDINGTATPATTGSKLSLGYYTAGGYAWMQSWSSTPLILNPYGNNVGIGGSTAAYQLDVTGTFRATGAATFSSSVTAGTQFNAFNDRNYLARGSFRLTSPTNNASTLDISVGDNTTYINGNYFSGGNDNTIIIGTYANYTNQLVLKPTGNVLIGTTTDDTIHKLQVTGSAKFTGTGHFQSPNLTSGYQILRSFNTALPVSTTTTIFRFLDSNGNLSGQNAIFGILNIYVGWNAGYNFGSNIYSYSISCSTNGIGVLTLITSNVVGASLITSVTVTADGTGTLVQATTNAVPTIGANCFVTFNGFYF